VEIVLDNLRTGTAKAVARLMSFAQITCMSGHVVYVLQQIAAVQSVRETHKAQSQPCLGLQVQVHDLVATVNARTVGG